MSETGPKCIYCRDKGWRWGRGSTMDRARMVKRACGYCKAGKAFKKKLTDTLKS